MFVTEPLPCNTAEIWGIMDWIVARLPTPYDSLQVLSVYPVPSGRILADAVYEPRLHVSHHATRLASPDTRALAASMM